MSLYAILLAIPWSLICLALILRIPSLNLRALPSTGLVSLFWLKLIGTFSLQYLYTFYYTDRSASDIFRFFDDGRVLSNVATHNSSDYIKILLGYYDSSDGFVQKYFDLMNAWIKPFESGFYNDNIFIIKVNSLLNFLSLGVYEINAIIISSLVFASSILIIKTLLHDAKSRAVGLVLISVFPFWMLMLSGVLKESLCIVGVGLIMPALHAYKFSLRIEFKHLITLFIGLYVLINIKPYFIVSIAPAFLLLGLWNAKNVRYSPWIAWGILVSIASVSALILDLNPLEYIVRKQTDFLNHASQIKPGSSFHMPRLEYSMGSLISAFPNALINSLLRPFPWQIRSIGEGLMFIENLILFALVFFAFVRSKFNNNGPLAFIIMAIIPGMILIGLISPVLGATMRYRAPFLLLLVIALSAYLQSTKNQETT